MAGWVPTMAQKWVENDPMIFLRPRSPRRSGFPLTCPRQGAASRQPKFSCPWISPPRVRQPALSAATLALRPSVQVHKFAFKPCLPHHQGRFESWFPPLDQFGLAGFFHMTFGVVAGLPIFVWSVPVPSEPGVPE